MKIIVLGCGKIGGVIARDLAESVDNVEIVAADKDQAQAVALAKQLKNGTWISLDAGDYRGLVDRLNGFDLAVGALPGNLGFNAIKAAIEAEVNVVDVSFSPENPLMLNGEAMDAGVTVIPDCGVAPGLSNMLVGYAVSKLDRAREVHIMVGGIPEHPIPPLDLIITWSVEGLIDEYMRNPRIIEKGRILEVPALSGLEEVVFPRVGKLEAFYTDGLRTLLHTISGVESMWEKTLRYKGHAEKIILLKSLGFFDDAPIATDDTQIVPRILTATLLERSLKGIELGDILAMTVEVAGDRQGEETRLKFSVLDRYDKEKKVTAMARTTAYTASIIARKLVQGAIDHVGVIPPERLGKDCALFEDFLSELNNKGVTVEGVSTRKDLRQEHV